MKILLFFDQERVLTKIVFETSHAEIAYTINEKIFKGIADVHGTEEIKHFLCMHSFVNFELHWLKVFRIFKYI